MKGRKLDRLRARMPSIHHGFVPRHIDLEAIVLRDNGRLVAVFQSRTQFALHWSYACGLEWTTLKTREAPQKHTL